MKGEYTMNNQNTSKKPEKGIHVASKPVDISLFVPGKYHEEDDSISPKKEETETSSFIFFIPEILFVQCLALNRFRHQHQ